jgi:hypothetical protein
MQDYTFSTSFSNILARFCPPFNPRVSIFSFLDVIFSLHVNIFIKDAASNSLPLHLTHQLLLKSHPSPFLQAVDLYTTINAYLLDPQLVFVHHNLQVEVGMKMDTPED